MMAALVGVKVSVVIPVLARSNGRVRVLFTAVPCGRRAPESLSVRVYLRPGLGLHDHAILQTRSPTEAQCTGLFMTRSGSRRPCATADAEP